MRPNAVVFLGMVYPWGIIRHFALLGIELAKAVREADYYFASISREPDKGAWQLVQAAIPDGQIIKVDAFDQLVSACDALFTTYEKVLVHCGGGWGQTKAFIPLRRKYGKRLLLVGTTHSYRHDSAMRIPMSAFQALLYLCYYDKIVFQCQYAADMFWGSRLLSWAKKSIVIPLGCEPFKSASVDAPRVIASKPDLLNVLEDENLFKFVYLAGFRPGKMHAWLVRSLASMLKSHPMTRILFCGTGEQLVIDDVRNEIKRQGVDDQILLPGQIPRDEVPWLLMHANCAVVPSRAETFGHNFLEPMFAGLPVLGTRVGVGRDIIKDGETGYGFSLSSTSSVQKSATALIEDADKTRQMGLRAKKLVEHDFTHTAVAGRLAKLYDELLRG